jgi:predicted nucleic acid-binding protein
VIVLDASAAVDWLLQTPAGIGIEKRIYSRKETLHCPHLLDLEVAHVLRRFVRNGTISELRGEEALQDLLALRITRYPHFDFLPRIWQYRHNLSAYDAAYLTLAEAIDAPLITRDARLGSASGHAVRVEVF